MSSVEREIEEVYPALSFYYGFSYRELLEFPRWIMLLYLRAIPGLLAEQELMAARAAAYPHLKNRGDQRGYVRDLQRLMRRGQQRKVGTPSVDELGRMGIKVDAR